MENRWLSINAAKAEAGKPPMIGMSITSRAASTPQISKSVSQMPSKRSFSMACASFTTGMPFCSQLTRLSISGCPCVMLRISTCTSAGTTGAVAFMMSSLYCEVATGTSTQMRIGLFIMSLLACERKRDLRSEITKRVQQHHEAVENETRLA